jgi:uncharacterized membrane protein YbhN (UPF0104 family)
LAAQPADRAIWVVSSRLKKYLLNAAKIAISIAILGFLGYKGYVTLHQDEAAYDQLVQQPKNWWLMLAALAVAVMAVLITFTRWWLLVRALALPFSWREAIRLSFVGYLFNFTLSIVGGDVIKAVAIAHRQPGRRTAAAATVIVDRLIGLYALFAVGAAATLFVDFDSLRNVDATQIAMAQRVCQFTQIMTLAGAVGFALLMLPGFATSSLWEAVGHIPKAGPALLHVLEAVRMYRRQPLLLLLTLVMSLAVHCLYSISIFLIAWALPGPDPSFAAHFVVAPIAMVAGAAPLPGGFGAMEGALAFMYQALSPEKVLAVQGLVIALAFRTITLVIACIGAIYYVVDRRELHELLDEAQHEPTTARAL